MLGEGLCPAASEYAAPLTEDCGGGGGGGGRTSCDRRMKNLISCEKESAFIYNFPTINHLSHLSMEYKDKTRSNMSLNNISRVA